MATNKYTELELMQARIEHVPADWLFTTIGKSYSIKNNLRKPINETERSKRQGPYPYYGPTKIQDYISTYEQDGSYVLIGEDGDHFLKYKDQCMTQLVDGKCTVNNHAHIIEGKKDASREWFYYYFMHRDIFSFLSRQGAGRYKLNKASLEKIPLLLPPLQEQQKIAVILSTWDKAIETTEKLINNSQMQKRALMQQLLTGKKRLLDENGERFSGKWEKVLLKNLCNIQTGKKDANEGTEKGKYPFFTCAKNHIYCDNHSFDCEAILIAGNGAIGTTHYYNGKFEAYQRTYVLNDFNTVINPLFLLYFINYWLHIDIKREQQRGAMPYIRVGLLQNFKVSLPSILEQEKIISVLSCINQEVKNLENKLEYLKKEKKALMQQLLTGKRRVKTDN